MKIFTFLFKDEKKPIGLCAFKPAFVKNTNNYIYNPNYKNPVIYPILLK